MLQACWQSSGEPLPIISAVLTAVNFSFGAGCRSSFAPGHRIVFGGGDEHGVGIFRIPGKAVGINIGGPIGGRPAFPTAAAGVSDIKSGTAGDIDSLRVTR